MEEFIDMNGTLMPLDIAADVTGLSKEELRKDKNYFVVFDPPLLD